MVSKYKNMKMSYHKYNCILFFEAVCLIHLDNSSRPALRPLLPLHTFEDGEIVFSKFTWPVGFFITNTKESLVTVFYKFYSYYIHWKEFQWNKSAILSTCTSAWKTTLFIKNSASQIVIFEFLMYIMKSLKGSIFFSSDIT